MIPKKTLAYVGLFICVFLIMMGILGINGYWAAAGVETIARAFAVALSTVATCIMVYIWL